LATHRPSCATIYTCNSTRSDSNNYSDEGSSCNCVKKIIKNVKHFVVAPTS